MSKSLCILLFSLLCAFSSADDLTNFQTCFSDNSVPVGASAKILYGPTNSAYGTVLQAYVRNYRHNATTTPKPALIVTPTEEIHVSAAVICSNKLNLQMKIRSGGHDYEGVSYVSFSKNPFIIIDLFNFRSIDVNMADQTAWVGSGAMLGELYYRISEKSKVHGFPAGVCPTVGVGGHLSGGGYGNMLRKYGLSVDHVVDAKIVDANGKVLDRASMGEDLFWAIRGGGGGSFGVILSYKINLVPVPEIVTVFKIEKFVGAGAEEAVFEYQNVMPKIDPSLFIRILLQPVTRDKAKTGRATFIGLFLGDSTQLQSITTSEFPSLGLQKSDCKEMSWINSVLYWANYDNTTSPTVLLSRKPESITFGKRKSDYVKTPIPLAGIKAIFAKLVEIGKPGLVFNSYGGKNSEIAPTELPFSHRAGYLYKIQFSLSWMDASKAADDTSMAQIRELYSFMEQYVSKNPREAYLNYRDLDIGTNTNGRALTYAEGKVYGEKYFLGNFERLVDVKSKVDPGNLFWNEQSIPVRSAPGRKLR